MKADAPQPPYVMVLTTCPSDEVADAMAGGLVEARLAACVQAAPIRSTYVWKGKVEREGELLLLIKTRGALASRVRDWIVAHHPYEVPEIVETPLAGGLRAYLSWIDETTAEA